MEHDFAGLEQALARQDYLLTALNQLCAFSNRHKEELTPRQQEFLKTAIHCTACLCNDMLEGDPA